jgi:AraC-like DNA-binding protein
MNLQFTMHVPDCTGYIRPHSHPVLEIVYYIRGKGTSTMSGETYPVGRNIVTITPAGTSHDQVNESPLSSLCVGVKNSGLEKYVGCWNDSEGALKKAVERLFEEIHHKRAGFSSITKGVLFEIKGLVERLTQTGPDDSPKEKIVKRALSIIREREGRVSLDDLSGELFLSKDYLRHLLTRETRQSPVRHIISARIEKAKALLSTGITVKAAALESGFDDIYYFSRLFKKVTSKSPLQFQKQSVQ